MSVVSMFRGIHVFPEDLDHVEILKAVIPVHEVEHVLPVDYEAVGEVVRPRVAVLVDGSDGPVLVDVEEVSEIVLASRHLLVYHGDRLFRFLVLLDQRPEVDVPYVGASGHDDIVGFFLFEEHPALDDVPQKEPAAVRLESVCRARHDEESAVFAVERPRTAHSDVVHE